MKRLMNFVPIVFGALLGITSTPSIAQTDGEWEFMFAPLFLWGMSIDGETALDGNSADMDLDFKDDLFENMEAAFTFHFEVRKDDLLLFAEYQ